MTTSVTEDQVAALRRMTNELTIDNYSDVQMVGFIESYPLVDELGTLPYYWDISTDPPTRVVTVGWIPTYDINAAAGDVWSEKAAMLASAYTFSADGGNYDLNAKYEHYMKMAAYYRSRRAIRQIPMNRGV